MPTQFKNFFIDLRKHTIQALSTLLAGFIIGALLGGWKVIYNQEKLSENQEIQTIQIQKLQESVDSLAGKDYDITELLIKVDSVAELSKETSADIKEINRTVDRIFELLD